MRFAAWSTLLWTFVVLSGRVGRAEPACQAEELLQQAITSHENARFEQALALLQRARGCTTDPALLGRIYLRLGVAHAVVEGTDEARAAFRAALALDPGLALDPAGLKDSIVELFRAVHRETRGRLRVRADRANAEVLINGKTRGRAPLELELPVGRHRVEVRAGGASEAREIVVRLDKEQAIAARLGPEVPAAPPRRRLLTWVAAGGAVVSLGVAIGLGASADASYREYTDESTGPERGAELRDAIQSRALGANVMFGVAGALALTSAVLFFIEPGTLGDTWGRLAIAPLSGPGMSVTAPF